MEIIKNKNGSKLNVALVGRLDTTTAPQLEETMNAELSDVAELIIDLAELQYVSSAGLRVLVICQKAMNKQGAMYIEHANESIMEIFEVTGFSDILTIR